MNTSLRKQIYENMDLRDSEELLMIWKTNDRVEWSDEAFEAIDEILRGRGVELPQQSEPVYGHHDEQEDVDELDGFSQLELKIIDDENPPDFYDPFQVIKFGRWLELAAIISVILSVAVSLMNYQGTRNLVLTFFQRAPAPGFVVFILTVLFMLIETGLQVLLTYFPLKVLAHILRILMEMEFNSRKPAPAPVTEN